MKDFDDHVIPYEEAVRRRRAIEEVQQREKGVHEVKMSDAMTHLLEEEGSPDEDGPSPETLRQIVEREFAGDDGRPGWQPAERPRPHLVKEPEDEPMGQLCDFETRRCEDPRATPEDPATR